MTLYKNGDNSQSRRLKRKQEEIDSEGAGSSL